MMTIAAVVMGVYSIMLTAFGALATGATRKNVYSGAKCILGGRCSAVFVSWNTPGIPFAFVWLLLAPVEYVNLVSMRGEEKER